MLNPNQAILLIHCPDKPGLINIITQFIYENQGNILDLDEHVDRDEGTFFMRVAWDITDFKINKEDISEVFQEEIADKFDLNYQLHFTDKVLRMAVFVSKSSHCLYDILSRHYSGEWQIEIPLIISNHRMHEKLAKRYEIPFYYFDINKKNKADVEIKQLELLKEYNIDFMILARYMQILSDSFIRFYPNKIINIHHSFLPAFAGAKPYHRAHERGVKIIGATAHYVTADLDEGPIIDQDVTRISHKDALQTLVRKGKDLEKIVLSRAIWLHLERKGLVYRNRTIIFD